MHEANSYTIFDSKAGAYMEPFFSLNKETAKRRFQNDINKAEGLFSKFPEDFSLYSSGVFSHETGIHTEQVPVHICNAITLKKSLEQQFTEVIPLTRETSADV